MANVDIYDIQPPKGAQYPPDFPEVTNVKSLDKGDAELIFGHCGSPGIVTLPRKFRGITAEGTVEPNKDVPLRDNHGNEIPTFEFDEHRYLGDCLILPEHDKGDVVDRSARYNPFTFDNGLKLTYGSINALAGDYFALSDPISGGDLEKRKTRFRDAFNSMSTNKLGKNKAEEILKLLEPDSNQVEAVRKNGGSVAKLYESLPLNLDKTDNITKKYNTGPIYTDLLKKNLDHFGPNARKAYNAGHAVALETAKLGGLKNLQLAYAMNAFADHFLEDSFASGHFRVPREKLTQSTLKNVACNLMHDEDGDNGLKVSSPSGRNWTAYGDTQLFETKNKDNFDQCLLALKESVQEVYDAYKTGTSINEDKFKAWKHAPSLDLLESQKENYPPMLRVRNGTLMARKGDKNITDWSAEYPLEGGIAGVNSLNWGKFGLANRGKLSEKGGKLVKEWLEGLKETFGSYLGFSL